MYNGNVRRTAAELSCGVVEWEECSDWLRLEVDNETTMAALIQPNRHWYSTVLYRIVIECRHFRPCWLIADRLF